MNILKDKLSLYEMTENTTENKELIRENNLIITKLHSENQKLHKYIK